MKYSIKRFSSPYSKDYENKRSEDYLEDIDKAKLGREIQALDEEADRVRWRSDLKKHKSRRGSGASVLGGPGGVAGKWVGDKVAEIADSSGQSDEEIQNVSDIAGTLTGLGAGLGAGYIVKKGLGEPADKAIDKAAKEIQHFEDYRKDVHKFKKLDKGQKAHITNEINKRQQLIRNAQRNSQIGRYAMPALGVLGALGAAKAVNDSVSERLSRRKAIDSENRRKKENQDQWQDFKRKAVKGLKKTGRYVKSIVTEDYRKDKEN